MILSMTGYGEAHHHEDDVSYFVEVRSVNNRYFKAAVKLPEHLGVFEPEVEKILRSRLGRGSVTAIWRVRDTRAEAAQEINVAALQRYVQAMQRVDVNGPVRIDLASVLLLPGVCQPPEVDDSERQRQLEIIERMTTEAVDHLLEMRRAEGKALRDDVIKHCDRIGDHLKLIAERAPTVVKEYHERLCQRTNDLLSQSKLELKLDDLRREVAVYADRCDINEEVARLMSHLDQARQLCDSSEHAGRKLEFLAQEMLREANTIASKSNDAEIAYHVVEIKGAIDRLKEQVQNVE